MFVLIQNCWNYSVDIFFVSCVKKTNVILWKKLERRTLFCNFLLITFIIHAGKNMFRDRNILIIEHGKITVMYTLLTLNMFLQAEKLLLSQCNNM